MFIWKKLLKHSALFAIATTIILQLGACARSDKINNDPYESFNRKLFAFNNVADSLLLRPATVTYTHVVPTFMRQGVHNFFNNIAAVTDVSNDILQGKGAFAISDTYRFLINSTWGIGGTIDVAQAFTFPPHQEDFGLTLATWGAVHSNYFVFPFLGPSTNRDAVGKPFDWFVFSAWPYLVPNNIYYPMLATWVLDKRAQLLPADALVQQSFDPYIFVRNAYMTMRAQEVKDNNLSFQEYRANFLKHRNTAKTSNAEGFDSYVTSDTNKNAGSADSGVIVVG